MSKSPPAEQIENPGRKPSWSQDQMEEAIDRYFEVGNFNRVAKECDVPVSTLFYKVKIDPRYGEEARKDVPKEKEEEAEPKPSPEEGDSDWEQLKELAILGGVFYGGTKLLSWLLSDNSTDTRREENFSGTDREKIEAASTRYRQIEENLRKATGLTDPFAQRVEPRHIAESVADSLGVDKEKIDKSLLGKLAVDWRDPGPLEEEIRLGEYRTVPASQISSDWKDTLDQFAEERDRDIKAYLKDREYDWGAILTPSGKVVRYNPGVATAEDWMKALGWDYPGSFG